MAKYQFPVDGRVGKDLKVTSPFGWRKHPTSGKKSHHNGVDFWKNGTVYNEAFADGKVIFAGPSELRKADGSVGGFGYHVMILHKIDGADYVSVYAHNEKDSVKVKAGQQVTAGTVVGKMGASGDVTGKHLHFEIFKGRKYKWSADGRGFVEPVAFIKALIAKEAAIAEAPKPTPEPAVIPVMPPASVVDVKPVVAAPVTAPAAPVRKSYRVQPGENYDSIAKKFKVSAAELKKINKNKPIYNNTKIYLP